MRDSIIDKSSLEWKEEEKEELGLALLLSTTPSCFF